MAYPTATDLEEYLQAAEILSDPLSTAQGLLDLSGAIAGAIEDFERDTGYSPFLADANDVTLYYSPNNIIYPPNGYPVLEFAANGGTGGMVSITSVTINLVNGTGDVLTLNSDYTLEPRNAALKSRPYTRIQFLLNTRTPSLRLGTDPNNIKIIGKRGYQTTLAAGVSQAILAKGAMDIISQLLSSSDSKLKAFEIDGVVKEQYEVGQLGKMNDAMNGIYTKCVGSYKRVVFE